MNGRMMLLGLGVLFIAWIGFTSFQQIGTNLGHNAVEATLSDFTRAEDGLLIVDGSRQREPYPVTRGGDATFYAVGRVAVRNYAHYCLNNSNPDSFNRTYSDDARVYYIEALSGEPTLVTMTSKPMANCS